MNFPGKEFHKNFFLMHRKSFILRAPRFFSTEFNPSSLLDEVGAEATSDYNDALLKHLNDYFLSPIG